MSLSSGKNNLKALVLGITGSYAGGVTKELSYRTNTRVTALVRNESRAQDLIEKRGFNKASIDLVSGDALQLNDLKRAAQKAFENTEQGSRVIVHGVNYPYNKWFPNMENVTHNVIEVAKEYEAMIVFPGNVYNLKPVYDTPLNEEHEWEPITRKGGLRKKMEQMLKDCSARVLIVRANDYFGPTVRNGLVNPMFEGVLKNKKVSAFGNYKQNKHEFVYIPDLSRATVRMTEAILDDPSSDRFQIVHFAGYQNYTTQEFLDLAAKVHTGNESANMPTSKLPWPLLRLVGLFDGVVSELMEMRYLFDNTLLLSDEKFKKLCPDFTPTPVREAIRETLESYKKEE